MVNLVTTVFAVRARLVDGAVADLLLFFDPVDAGRQADYIREHCSSLGFDRIEVVRRRVIGVNERLERRGGSRTGEADRADKQ